MGNIKVSILIPFYKSEQFIEKCIRSVLEQSYKNIEYIFIDDCGGDNSNLIVSKTINDYPNRIDNIKFIHNIKNIGIAKCRELLIKESTGDYVFFIDSDDWIEKDTIRLLVNSIKNETIDMVTGNIKDIYSKKVLYRVQNVCSDPRHEMINIMKRKSYWNVWNRLIKRSLLINVEIPDIDNGEDFIIMSQLYKSAKQIVFINDYTYNYNHLNESAFQKRYNEIKNIRDREAGILYLMGIYPNDKEIQDALNAGLLNAKIVTLINLTTLKDIRNFKIESYLLTNFNYNELKYIYKLIVRLYSFKLYWLIYLINIINLKINTKN